MKKKYTIKASVLTDEVSVPKNEIHDCALDMVYEILEDGKERWGEYSASNSIY